jgi:hypothetical protein
MSKNSTRFHVATVLILRIQIFLVVMPPGMVTDSRLLKRTYHLHVHWLRGSRRTFEDEGSTSLQTTGINNPISQHNNPEDLNPP